MRGSTRILLLALLLAGAAFALPSVLNSAEAKEKAEKAEKPQPHSDEDVEKANERFKQDYKGEDMGKRVRILRWYGLYMHKDVLKRLRKILLKEKNPELQALAATGVGNQLPYAKKASRTLLEAIDKYKQYAGRNMPEDTEEILQAHEAAVLVNALVGLGKLGIKPDKKNWKMIRNLINHNHDAVAVAMLEWVGTTKEWRALPMILSWFEFYPDGYSWSGGSVKVDTGAAGGADAAAAKAKFNAKYGGRAKKSRPAAHAAMKQALFDITGLKFETSKELKDWMKENKALLKKKGV